MKDIGSVTGRLARGLTASSETGSQRGETGYLERPRRFYGLDHEPTQEPAPLPAVRQERRNTLQKQTFSTLSPLPELRPALLPPDRNGDRGSVTLLANSADLPALKSLIAEIHEELRPEDPAVISATLARLLSHYPSQQAGNAMTVAEDWLEDMSTVSAKAFHAAVVGWRRSTSAFKPSPGQLLAKIEAIEEPLRKMLETATEVVHREETMPVKDRLNHLHQWLYEVEHLGIAPFEIMRDFRDDFATYQAYLDREAKRLRGEIKALEAQEH